MSSSATRTNTPTRLAQLCSVVFLLGTIVALNSSTSVTAQQDPSFRSSADTNKGPADEADTATEEVRVDRPAGSISPRVIAKTFLATAYSIQGRTAAGVTVRRGIVAADPKVLPLGSIVRIHAGKYSGLYTVLDTGGDIRGQRIDIYFPSRSEAIRFGKRKIKVEVLRHGWAPEEEVASAS